MSESAAKEQCNVKINKTNSSVSDITANGLAVRSNATSDTSADFGYHSRLCVDLNPDLDGENCSCSLEGNANSQAASSAGGKKGAKACGGGRRSATSITRGQFEGILKTILGDYVRIKNENEVLRRELEARGGSPGDILKNLTIPEPEHATKRYIEVEHVSSSWGGLWAEKEMLGHRDVQLLVINHEKLWSWLQLYKYDYVINQKKILKFKVINKPSW